MRKFALPLLVLLLLGVILLYSSFFVVRENQEAIVLELGEIVQEQVPPGLHFKKPFISTVHRFDTRVRTLDGAKQRVIVLGNAEIDQNDNMPLEVNYYINWQIADTKAFYLSTGGRPDQAEVLMMQRGNKVIRDSFGGKNIQEVVSDRSSELINTLAEDVSSYASRELGIRVTDARVERIDFPSSILAKTYETMESAWAEQAEAIRANGASQAIAILAAANKNAEVTKAEAVGNAEVIKGEGEASAAGIYANAFGQDPEFYEFYRSLKVYENSLANGDSVLVLKPDSKLLQYLLSSQPD